MFPVVLDLKFYLKISNVYFDIKNKLILYLKLLYVLANFFVYIYRLFHLKILFQNLFLEIPVILLIYELIFFLYDKLIVLLHKNQLIYYHIFL